MTTQSRVAKNRTKRNRWHGDLDGGLVMIDINQDGVTREWRISVGDMAREHFALRFSATRLGAIRRFNAMVRTQPTRLDIALALAFVNHEGRPCKSYRFSSGKASEE